jgi:hypothetical protein
MRVEFMRVPSDLLRQLIAQLYFPPQVDSFAGRWILTSHEEHVSFIPEGTHKVLATA